jgi:hypothetical protein
MVKLLQRSYARFLYKKPCLIIILGALIAAILGLARNSGTVKQFS